jgi:hypothetical protein
VITIRFARAYLKAGISAEERERVEDDYELKRRDFKRERLGSYAASDQLAPKKERRREFDSS